MVFDEVTYGSDLAANSELMSENDQFNGLISDFCSRRADFDTWLTGNRVSQLTK
jgi:hypothetical protein